MSKLTTVGGIESHPMCRDGLMEIPGDGILENCNRCGAIAGFRVDPRGPVVGMVRAECSNSSCAIATPFHYRTWMDAAYAWNRKPGDPPKRLDDAVDAEHKP